MILQIIAIIIITVTILIRLILIIDNQKIIHRSDNKNEKKQKINSKDKIILSDTITNNEYSYKNIIEKNSFCPCCFDDTSVHYIKYISWMGYLSDFEHISERPYLRNDDIRSIIDEVRDCMKNTDFINDESDISNKYAKWCRLYLECKKCNSKWITEPFLASTRPEDSFIQTDICKYYEDNKKKKG
jgi:hypothetical protein